MPQTQTEITRTAARAPFDTALIDAAEDAVIACSQDGVIHTWNAAAERLLGYPAGEVLGQPVSMLDPEQPNERCTAFARVAHGERTAPFITQLVGKGERLADVSLTISPINDHEGKLVGVLEIARDVGAELRAQRRLRESEARLRALVDSSPIMIWSTDPSGKVQFMNAAYRQFLGKGSNDLLLGNEWQSLVHPDDRPAFVAAFTDAMTTQAPAHAIARSRRADGEWRWLEAFTRPRVADGRLLGMVGCTFDITERRQAEEALRRREEELMIITDGLPALIAYIDKDLRYRFMNFAYEKWFGQPRESMLTHEMREVLGEEVFETLLPYIETALSGQAIQFETWAKYRRGGARYIHAHYLPRRARDGRTEGFFVLVFDLTARKLAEEALRESEARERARGDILDALMDHVPTGITIADRDGTLRMVSRYGAVLAATSPEKLTAVAFPDYLSAWDIEHLDHSAASLDELPLVRAITRGEIVRDEEWILRRRDGVRIAVLSSAGPIRNSRGEITGGIVAWHDISERKRAEEYLKRSESALRRAQKVAHVGSYDYDLVAGTAEWSEEFYEILGVPRDTPAPSLDAAMRTYVHPDDQERAQALLASALATGHSPPVEVRLVRADGRECTVLAQGEVTERDKTGKATRFVGILMDITERKRIEAEALRAQKLESIGVLAGGIAHDFNNLLTAVFGNIQLATINARGQSDVVEPLHQAEKAFQAARSLTHQLLTFSRGGAPVCKTIDIRGLLRDSVSFALHGSNVGFEFDLAADLRPASVDREQMDRAINNIVINAKEAMPDGGHLKVSARNLALDESNPFGLAAGSYVEACFEDTGSGIEVGILDTIFDPYFTTKPHGNGLGLPTVYSIMKRHDGHVSVESEAGHGARFCLYLPASTAAMPEPAAPPAIVSGDGRVLLMDDDPLLRRIGAQLLENLGYRVVVAANGEEAVSRYCEALQSGQRFAAVILDLTVPGAMGGEACLQRLREIDPGVRAIVSSGYSTDPVVAHYREHGFSGVVPKPYRLDELSVALASVMGGRPARGPAG